MTKIWNWFRALVPQGNTEILPTLSQEEIDADLLYNIQPNGTFTW